MIGKLQQFLHSLWRAQLFGEQAALAAMTAALFNFIGMVIYVLGIPDPRVPIWPGVLSAVIGLIFAIILFTRLRSSSRMLSSGLFLLNALVITIALGIMHVFLASYVPHWVDFRANQLGCIVAALLAPTFMSGLLAILIHMGGPLLEFNFLSLHLQNSVEPGTFLATVAYGVGGIFILTFRYKRLLLEEEYSQTMIDSEANKTLAHNFLHLRDLMNTPLQTLELVFETMEEEKPNSDIVQRGRRALAELERLNAILIKYEQKVDWKNVNVTFGNRKANDDTA